MKQVCSFHHMASEIQTEPSKKHLFRKIIYFREIGKNFEKEYTVVVLNSLIHLF
jgi:t-SNARE complex subunit (syntaxin)